MSAGSNHAGKGNSEGVGEIHIHIQIREDLHRTTIFHALQDQ